MDEPSAQASANARQRELEAAFAVVFGQEARRSAEQALVWATFATWGFDSRPMIYPSPAGTIDPNQTMANAASHAFFASIKRLVAAGSLPANPGNHPLPSAVRDS